MAKPTLNSSSVQSRSVVFSVLRIALAVLISVLPPILAALVNPALDSGFHTAIFGSFAITFAIIDRLFYRFLGQYDGLHKSKALTLRQSEKLQAQIGIIKRKLSFSWWLGVSCRVILALLTAYLLTLGSQSVLDFYVMLSGYLIIGFSLCLFAFFWISFYHAEKFKSWFENAEIRETKREEVMKELNSQPLVEAK